jgi:hypothetical protein
MEHFDRFVEKIAFCGAFRNVFFIWFAVISKFGSGGKLINAVGVERVAVKTGGEMNNYHFTN